MASDVLEVIMQIVIEALPKFLGAFLKWVYLGFKIPFSKVYTQKGNTIIGVVTLGIMIVCVLLIFK